MKNTTNMITDNADTGIVGYVTITDPSTGEVLVDKRNSIAYETMSLALANSLANRGKGFIYQMAFGNGASSVDSTGGITYLPPNTVGTNGTLYNQTYVKVVDDTSVYNTDPTRNKITISHTSGTNYTDILIQCLLDFGEPSGQDAFDNGTQSDSTYTFDELGIVAYWGTSTSSSSVTTTLTKLITHLVFHPVQKSLNRQIQVDYTIRINSLTNQVTL